MMNSIGGNRNVKGNIYPFILIGHVDYGKSTLAGHLLKITETISKYDIEKTFIDSKKNGKERMKYSNLLDINPEEREKGKTNEYSVYDINDPYHNHTLGDWFPMNKFRLIDTPGHQHFIRQTIEAIGKNISEIIKTIGVIIISVIENEFVAGFEKQGMVKEQLKILRASGIENIIIVLNKIDVYEGEKLSIQVESIKTRLKSFLSNLKFKNIKYLEMSAYEGFGIHDLLPNIKKMEEKNETTRYMPNKTKDIVVCSCYIFENSNILTNSYKCIAHILGVEYNVEIIGIKNTETKKNITYINKGSVLLKIKFEKNISYKEKTKILFRKDLITIGYGIMN